MSSISQFWRLSAITRIPCLVTSASFRAAPSSVRCLVTGLRSSAFAKPSLLAATIAVALTANVGSVLSTCPHTLSYFNEVVGGPLNGASHLLDGNIDWGQDLLFMKEWYEIHPHARPFGLTYLGFISPRVAGFDFVPIPQGCSEPLLAGGMSRNADFPMGWYAMSANELHGYRFFPYDDACVHWLTRFCPMSRAGYSILIFRVMSKDKLNVNNSSSSR